MYHIGSSLWIAWTLIGIIGGFMVGKLIPHVRNVTLSVCVGICGALLGGFLFTIICGAGSIKIDVLSLLASAAICGVFLWIMAIAFPHRDNHTD